MTYSISLNNFKKIAAVATFLATAACLVPAPAKAIMLAQISGGSINGSFMSFEIDNSVLSSESAISAGYFPKAIKNFKFGSIEGEGNSKCPSYFKGISGFDIFESQPNILSNCVGFKEGNLQKEGSSYQVTFDTTNDDNFLFSKGKFFTKENFKNSQFMVTIDSLNTTEPIITVQNFPEIPNSSKSYTYTFINGGSECSDKDSAEPVKYCSIKTVPDPSATTSLLGVGAIGTLSLVRRNRRYKKLALKKLELPK
jgi:hypothetical protein